MNAVMYNEGIPEKDLIAVVRSLLHAGADVQEPFHDPQNGMTTTVLEAAIPRKSPILVQLLLNSGARITQSAFAKAAEYCDLSTLELFIKYGTRVTEEIVKYAAKNEDTELFWFVLDAAEVDIKHKCKCAALRQCISDGNLDLIEKLEASGAKLGSYCTSSLI